MKGARCYHPRPLETLHPGPGPHPCQSRRHGIAAWAALVCFALLAGCMGLPDVSERHWDRALPARSDSALVRTAQASVPPGELSGLRLVASGPQALRLRLALIDAASVSLDIQVYQFKGDASGRLLMRALRDAAARGVRVRLLVDDLYTAGDDALWLGLAATPGVEVRLFNPFMAGRDSHLSRLVESALGSDRMHRRMHNKLLVADGALAIAGGRNIADEYFLPAPRGSYVDIDVLVAGALVPQMAVGFDLFWNSEHAHALHTIVDEPLAPAPRQRAFARAIEAPCSSAMCQALGDVLDGDDPLLAELSLGRMAMHVAIAQVAYDSPDKIENEQASQDMAMLATSGTQVRLLVEQAMRQARRELLIVSPYLIPGAAWVAGLADLQRRGVRVTLLTNSLAATDEPMAHLGYRRYRAAILAHDVALYEWSPARGSRVLREMVVGGTVQRLHAKAAIVDREVLYLGSMNFDPRSRDLNTEFGLLVRCPALAEEVHALVDRLKREGALRLHLDADGRTLYWTVGDEGPRLDGFEPDTDFGSRLLLDLLEPLVPEELL